LKRESPLTLHPKLFSDDHVPDIVGTSGSASDTGRRTKQEIVAALKDTYELLDERKAQFELMIHSLEGENADAEMKKQRVGRKKKLIMQWMKMKMVMKILAAALRQLNNFFYSCCMGYALNILCT